MLFVAIWMTKEVIMKNELPKEKTNVTVECAFYVI